MKGKINRTFINEKGIDIYELNIPSTWVDYDYITENHITHYGKNITANKATHTDFLWFGLIGMIGSWFQDKTADNLCDYESFMYYPMTTPVSNYTSLVGVKRPKNKVYPTLLEFKDVGFGSLITNLGILASKNNFPYLKTLNPFIINQSGAYLGKQLAKEDKYYLDVNTLNIYDKQTGAISYAPDEKIFRPRSGSVWWWFDEVKQDYQKSICRQWYDWRYFGSQLKAPKYTLNQSKLDEYINSILKEGETFVSFERIDINTTPKDDIKRYILEHIIPEYYHDYNDEFIFTVQGNEYTFDFDLEELRDSNGNVIEMIEDFPHTVITMGAYSDLVRNFINLEQTAVIDEILEKVRYRDFNFQDISFPQKQPYNFTNGMKIKGDYSTTDVLEYKTNDGLVPIDSTEDLKKAISENYPLIEYDSGKLSYHRDLDETEIQRISTDKAAFMLFNTVTNTRDINVSGNASKYFVYLYEKYQSNKQYNQKDIIDIEPILVIDGVTCMSKIIMRTYTGKWRRKYIDKSERLNYAKVYEDFKGFYVYENISTKVPEKVTKKWLIEKEDGSIEEIEKEIEYTSEPQVSTKEIDFVEDLVKFSLPKRTVHLDTRIKKTIQEFKNNNIDGYFLKYQDRAGKNRIKLITLSYQEYYDKVCDKEDSFLDILPIVPLYSNIDNVTPIKTRTGGLRLRCGLLAAEEGYRYFHYVYDNKVNSYYRRTFQYQLKQWETALNGQIIDKEYKVKTKKKVGKAFTDRNLPLYRGPFLENKKDSFSSEYEKYYDKKDHGYYGFHSSVRFTFAIFFNKYVRKTKLLNKMAIEYLEFYFKNFNGKLGQEVTMFVYPNDRIQYIEKRLLLSFTKRTIPNNQLPYLKAKYYSEFNYNTGKMTFYDKNKKVTYELDINKLYPRWKKTFFPNRTFIKTSNKYDYMTITKDDLTALKFTDTLPKSITPTDTYIRKDNVWQLELSSLFYNTPVRVKFNTTTGAKEREINFWKDAIEYTTFYTPYDLSTFNDFYKVDYLENFQERNVINYLTRTLQAKSADEIALYYNQIFNKNIKIEEDIDNIFDYNKMFSNGFLTNPEPIDFSKEYRDEVIQNIQTLNLQDFYENKPYVNLDVFQTQALYNDFKTQNLLTPFYTKTSCIKEIVDKLFLDELPMIKVLTPDMFKDYFVNYNKNGLLASMFTEREIYEIGFQNYLVSDDIDTLDDISILLPKIFEQISKFIYKFDVANNNMELANYWLPLPADAYKKFPFYSKKFVTTYFHTYEYYMARSIPTVNGAIKGDHRALAIANAIIGIVIAIIMFALSVVSGGSTIAGALAIISSIFALFAAFLNLVILFVPPEVANMLRTLAKIFSIISSVTGGMSGALGGVGSGLNTVQIANIAVMSVDFCLQIASEVVKLVYEKEKAKDTKRLNDKIDEYNKNVDELWDFLETHEFDPALEMVNPTNTGYHLDKKTEDNYDDFYNKYIDGSLVALYTEVDVYYDKRVSE